MAEYVAVIRKTEGTDYWVDVPDIPGCVSRGESIAAAKANFREALSQHLETIGASKQSLNPPRKAEALTAEELEGAVETYIVEI